MEVTRHAGIETARTTIEHIANQDVLVISRYDRRRDANGNLERIHQEDLAQALGSATKYQDEGFPNTYNLASVHGVEPGELFDRMIVHWLVGNCDAHAKNYSVLEPGTQRARLAPMYDVVSTEAYEWLQQIMGTSIGSARKANEVTANAIEHMGRKLGLEESPAQRASGTAERVLEAMKRCRRDGTEQGPVPVHRINARAIQATAWGKRRDGTRRETSVTKAAQMDRERQRGGLKDERTSEPRTPRQGRGPGC